MVPSFMYWCLLVLVLAGAAGRKAPTPGKCSFTRVYRMIGADCAAINLVDIPSTLSSDTEVLDASVNRIRILRNTSFEPYEDLRFLYLADNSIATIEAGAFASLSELEVLDLSLNAVRDLPPSLPPLLRRLYLSDNPLQTVPLSQATALTFLSLSNCMLTQLPTLGTLPDLRELNLSGNPLSTLTPAQLAPLCRLDTLHLPDTLVRQPFVSSCDCQRLQLWTAEHSIRMLPSVNCTIQEDSDSCGNYTNWENEAFSSCLSAYHGAPTPRWAYATGVAVCVFLVTCCLAIFWRHRRRARPKPQLPPRIDNTKTLLEDSKTKPRF